jgi:hypothetical protein
MLCWHCWPGQQAVHAELRSVLATGITEDSQVALHQQDMMEFIFFHLHQNKWEEIRW